MPVIVRHKGFRFYFYSNEGIEPMHVHVRGGSGQAKFWLHPIVHLDSSIGLGAGILRELAEIVEQNVALIERAWDDHFG